MRESFVGGMEIEVELKYLVDEENVEHLISELLSQQNITFEQSKKVLNNSYFDTEELTLRHLDMGLRVRTSQGLCEQTIKTAGKIVGGLHQRPEYNVAINASEPDLALFPSDIWPESFDISSIKDSITAIFTTHFERKIWLIRHALGDVELVFDQGSISSEQQSSQIKEIELELVSGDISALFQIAKLLFSQLTLRSGLQSKAARGYQLWYATKEERSSDVVDTSIELADSDSVLIDCERRHLLIPVNSGESPREAFYQGIEFCLTKIQHGISDYVVAPTNSTLFAIRDSLQALQYGMLMFDSEAVYQSLTQQIELCIRELAWLDKAQHVAELTVKSGNYRKKVENSQKLIEVLKLKRENFPKPEYMAEKLQSEVFNNLQLDLLTLILLPKKKTQENELMNFAEQALERELSSLLDVTSQREAMSASQYIELKLQLTKSLLAGSWFGNLYIQEQRQEYRRPWLDILSGIDELEIYALLQKQLQQLEEQPDKLIRWLDTKVENLVDALEYSRKMAIAVTPYWREV